MMETELQTQGSNCMTHKLVGFADSANQTNVDYINSSSRQSLMSFQVTNRGS